jgi:hypothetical protein
MQNFFPSAAAAFEPTPDAALLEAIDFESPCFEIDEEIDIAAAAAMHYGAS